jgi:hypothetical protein
MKAHVSELTAIFIPRVKIVNALNNAFPNVSHHAWVCQRQAEVAWVLHFSQQRVSQPRQLPAARSVMKKYATIYPTKITAIVSRGPTCA